MTPNYKQLLVPSIKKKKRKAMCNNPASKFPNV